MHIIGLFCRVRCVRKLWAKTPQGRSVPKYYLALFVGASTHGFAFLGPVLLRMLTHHAFVL